MNSEISNRLHKNWKKFRKGFSNEQTDCFRLYDRDLPNFPFIVEYFGGEFVVWERKKNDLEGDELRLEELLQGLKEFNQGEVHLKKRFKQDRSQIQYQKNSQQEKWITVKENNISYLMEVSTHLDVGLFLDHRPLRKLMRSLPLEGKSFLNLFCYTSSVSVCAALAGAKTTNIDLSHRYLDWSKKNFQANSLLLDGHKFIREDVLNFLKMSKTQFDIIYLDPPTFSNSKKMQDHLDIQRDHSHMIQSAMSLLRPDGTLYFSTNSRKFKIDEEISQKYLVRETTLKTIPIDFRDKSVHASFTITKKD